MTENNSDKLIRFLRYLSFVEGSSLLLLLFVAMPIKYILGNPSVVKVVGMTHGLLFVALVFLICIVASEAKWPKNMICFALASAVLPFGMFALDRKLKR